METDTCQRIIKRLLVVSKKKVPPSLEQSLFESGWLDSFVLVDFMAALEEEFSIRIPSSDVTVRKFDSIARIENYVNSRPKHLARGAS